MTWLLSFTRAIFFSSSKFVIVPASLHSIHPMWEEEINVMLQGEFYIRHAVYCSETPNDVPQSLVAFEVTKYSLKPVGHVAIERAAITMRLNFIKAQAQKMLHVGREDMVTGRNEVNACGRESAAGRLHSRWSSSARVSVDRPPLQPLSFRQ